MSLEPTTSRITEVNQSEKHRPSGLIQSKAVEVSRPEERSDSQYIHLTGNALTQYFLEKNKLTIPKDFQHSFTPIKLKKPSLQLEDQKLELVKPQKIKLHVEIPGIETYQSNFEQLTGNLTSLFVLFPQGREFVKAALHEEKLLSGATANA